ncbi:PLP-dependent aminotransferase family protein [Streptacidiphilus sp. PB12-B1b]|uniref:MocR-like transcription factor YczR n=1 Tax=Streptacidiphilus sp. PB12-B1b TaxID=2705012 RepID=UPI0015FC7924|nr:PLP-dependent aminotransferase family protein [Streptacidiphilus sp. PB12-B1b]QMU75897.1 PLP-dependent aminotransferase family protein [Streptacidiphilus sp. PB12-B1b]
MTARSSIGAAQLDRALGDWQQGRESAYRSLGGALRTLVLDGRVPVQTRLPSERELAAALGVSRTTVAAAYELLRAEGFLASRRGAGSWTALPAGRPMPVAGLSPFPTDGGGVIDLGVAALSAPEPWISEAMAAAVAELPSYTRTHGDFPFGLQVLRQAVADRFTRRGLPTGPEQVMVTAGAAGALSLLLRLSGPAERIAVESPSYANALQAIRFGGARAVPVPLAEDGWQLDAWSRTLREAAPALAYVIPDFQNPTGLLMPEQQRQELVALARATGTQLIVDETMAELSLEPDGPPAPRPLAAFDRTGSVITIGSAGKTFWGGLRIGWIRARPELIRRLAADRSSMDVCSPVVEQLAVRHLLAEALPELLAFQRRRVREQRDALVAAVRQELPGWTFRVPGGGLSLWVRTDDAGPGGSALATAAERFGVWIGSGPRFGVDGVLERFVRLPYAQPPEVSREAVRRLAAAAAGGPSASVPGEFSLL